MQVTWANFSIENIKWHIFLDFCRCSNANLYSRTAGKLSKGSNSSTSKNVSIDIGVIGYGNTKTVILTKKKHKKKKKKHKKKHYHTIKSHLKKKSSTLIRLKCIWHLLAS